MIYFKKWTWSSKCTQAVRNGQTITDSFQCFDSLRPQLTIETSCQCIPVWVGAIISHVLPGGDVKPIAFVSRSLSNSEQNYAQIVKEALALTYIWSTEISCIYFWQEIHTGH